MKEIKNYLHLYLGCQFIYNNGSKVWDGWTGFEKTNTWYYDDEERNHIKLGGHLFQVKLLKPILRPLSDMTEEETDYYNDRFSSTITDAEAAEKTRWLLSKHFDLFGLIEAGLAIDKTTLNKQP